MNTSSSLPAESAPLDDESAASRPPAPVQSVLAIPAKKESRSRSNTILVGAAALVAVAGLAFAAGRLTAPAAAASSRLNGGFGGGYGTAGTNRAGFGGIGGIGGGITVEGTVSQVADGKLTITTANGQTETIDTSSGTTYHSQGAADASQVTAGTKVLVRVSGGGFNRAPGQDFNGAPGASGAPVQGGGVTNGTTRTFTASDVTIVGS